MAGLLEFSITNLYRIGQRLFTNKHMSSLDKIEPFVTHKTLHQADFINKDLLIVGDVHGCYDEMILLLEKAKKMTQKKIVVIFVGDIINKGPKNMEMVKYLRNTEDTFTIRGNHEVKILKQYMDYKSEKISKSECKKWILDLTPSDITYLVNLPYTYSIPFLKLIIVHAGLMPGRPLHMQTKNNMVNMRNICWVNDGFNSKVYQGTYKASIGEAWGPMWKGPEHVYFGHDAMRKLQQHDFCTGLDTGCVYGGKLTGVLLHLPQILNNVDLKLIKKEVLQITPLHVYKPVESEF